MRGDPHMNECLVIDGVIDDEGLNELIGMSVNWFMTDRPRRRLLFVASMAAAESRSKGHDQLQGILIYRQHSWSWQEYCEAVSNPVFANIVSPSLDASKSADSLQEKLEAKFYFAGGCARYMLEWKTAEVIQEIDKLVREQDVLRRFPSSATGNLSRTLTDRLLRVYDAEKRYIVSKYAEARISFNLGPRYIRDLANQACIRGNPVADGTFLEAFFFACAWTGGIKLCEKISDDKYVDVKWVSRVDMKIFDPSRPTPLTCPLETWLKPTKWNHAAFDGVFLRSRGNSKTVIFIQIARSDRYGIDLSHCRSLLEALETHRRFLATEVEISFIVPTSVLATYRVGPVQNPHSLR